MSAAATPSRRPGRGGHGRRAGRHRRLPGHRALGVVVLGALLGTGTGLLAVGLVLTYRSHRVVNFAYGAMGGLRRHASASGCYLGKGWPWPAAMIVGVAAGVVVGAARANGSCIRRFERSPRLVLTVATIGLAQVLRPGTSCSCPRCSAVPPLVGALPDAAHRRPASTVDPLVI